MTKVQISNADSNIQSTSYYIEIEAIKIEWDYQSQIQTEMPKPIAKAKQGDESITYFIDLQKRLKVLTITGYIDKYSSKDAGWDYQNWDDVSVVRKRLEYMWDRGGTVKILIGQGDGYDDITGASLQKGDFIGTDDVNAEVFEGLIEKINFVEGGDDHIDRAQDSESYPKAAKERVDKYLVVLSIKWGVLR